MVNDADANKYKTLVALKKYLALIQCYSSIPSKPHTDANKYKTLVALANKQHDENIQEGLKGTSLAYSFNEQLSNSKHQAFSNPGTKKAVVSFRGTDMHDQNESGML